MKADHFEQQKLLDLAAEDVALTQLTHRGRTLPEVAAVEAAEEAEADAGDRPTIERAKKGRSEKNRTPFAYSDS